MRAWLTTVLVALLALPLPANAVTNKGLYITPARAFIMVDPGGSAHGSITVANYTDHPLAIKMSVEQFTVADYTYDYQFAATHDNWLTLNLAQTNLSPGKSQEVTYTATPPANVTPGGHYFAIFATATPSDNSSKNQSRATTVLYATVDGGLQVSSEIKNVSIPRFAFGDIPYDLQIHNTGNIHFFVYPEGGLNGLPHQKNAAHLLMPQTTRQISGIIAAPLLPGIYTATYGYMTDSGQIVQRASHILYMPLWFLLVLGGLLWIMIVGYKRYKRHRGRRFKGSSPPRYTSLE